MIKNKKKKLNQKGGQANKTRKGGNNNNTREKRSSELLFSPFQTYKRLCGGVISTVNRGDSSKSFIVYNGSSTYRVDPALYEWIPARSYYQWMNRYPFLEPGDSLSLSYVRNPSEKQYVLWHHRVNDKNKPFSFPTTLTKDQLKNWTAKREVTWFSTRSYITLSGGSCPRRSRQLLG